MKKPLFLLAVALFTGLGVLQGQVLTESFNTSAIPTGWTQSNSCSSTSANASWKITTSIPGYDASGFINHSSTSGYAMWVDGSSPYPCDVTIETQMVDITSLTSPVIEFYWAKNNTQLSYPQNNILDVAVYDGSTYHDVWRDSTNSTNWQRAYIDLSCSNITSDSIAIRFTVEKYNGSASFYNDIIVDDIEIKDMGTCAPPASLSVSNISTTADVDVLDASCSGTSAATSAVVLYGVVGFDPSNSNSGSSVTTTNGSATLTGLLPSTQYEVYTYNDCGTGSVSDTIGPVSFFSPCGAATTPFSENFDGGSSGSYNNASLPNCWEYYSNALYPYWYVRNFSTYANSGSQMLYGYKSSATPSGTTYGDTAFAASPEIQGLDSATKMVKFYARTSSASYQGMVIVGVTDANATPSSFKIIDTIYASTTYDQYTMYLDSASGISSGDARVAFAWIYDGSFDYVYIDDVEITNIPPCPEPIGISLVGATQQSVTVNWSSSSSTFQVEVGPQGFTQGTGNVVSVSGTSHTATGLTENTYYDVYVMSDCSASGDGTSSWVGPFTVKTECGDQLAPYTEGFEGFSSGSSADPNLPDCWYYAKTGTSTSFYAYNYNSTSYSNTGSNSLRFYGYASTTSTASADGDTLAAFSPRIAGLGDNDKQVIFNVRSQGSVAYYNNKIIVATADTNASLGSIHIVDTINTTGTYQEFTVDLDNVPTTSSRVVFMIVPEFVSGYTYSYTYAYVDDIKIRDIPTCPEPANVVAVTNNDSTISFTWTDSSAVSQYFIEWGPTGFAQGTGLPIDTVMGTAWSVDTLMGNTTYDFYIQSECASQNVNSPWVGPITVTTPCAPITSPYVEGFENLPSTFGTQTDPNLPSCWVQDRGVSASYMRGMTNSFSAYAGSGYVEFWGLAMNSDTVLLSSPAFSDIADGKMVTFYSLVNSPSYLGEFQVGLSDFSGTLASAHPVADIELTTTYQEFQVFIDSSMVQSGDARIAFIFPEGQGQWNDLKVDSVRIEDIPACVTYDHMATNLTDSSADLTWKYSGNGCFNIEYGPQGFIQGTGVGALSGTVDTNVATPYTLSGLNPNTSYDFYVESCCNPGLWEGPFTFTTECTGPLAGGTYSVGPTGDFSNLDTALSVMNVCGIGGAVTLELQSGTFTVSQPIGAINGISATNTVTIKGSAATNDTILGNLVLAGAQYVNLEDLYIRSTGGYTVRLSETQHVSITGCTIEAATTTSSTAIPIVSSSSATSYSSATTNQDLTISGNTITGGYFSMTFYGSSSNTGGLNNIEISDNDISGSYYYGIYAYYGRNFTISGNDISGFTNTYNYSMYVYNIDGIKITKNVSDSYYSLIAYYLNTTSVANFNSEISNNMWYNGYYGMRIYYSDNLGVYHNSALGTYYGLYDYYNNDGVEYVNNIFVGGTYALYSYYSTAYSDYNIFNSNGTNLAYVYNGSANYATDSASLVAIDTTQNLHSRVGDPIFASTTDLHVFGPLANDNGDNSVGITEDIDGDVRPSSSSTTVDIGADEYDVVGDDAALSMLVSPNSGVCGSDSLLVSVEIQNFGQNTLTSLDVSADLLGTTLTVNATGLSVPFGGTDTIELGYVSNYVGGPMSIVAYTQLSGDGRSFNDTLSTSIDVNDAQQVVPVVPTEACLGETISLSIAHPTDGSLMWSSNGDTLGLVAADSTMSLVLTQDTTLTLSAASSQVGINNYKGMGTTGANYNYYGTVGLTFSVAQPSTLDSVTVYPNSAGTTNIEIQDLTTGTAVWSTAVATTTTGNNPEQVYLGAPLQQGNFRLVATSSTTGGLYREYGVTSFPLSTPGGEVTITNGTLSGYHYFFYNWVVTVGGCPREDSTVTILVSPDPIADLSLDTANVTITATDWTVNWDATGTTGADSVVVTVSNGTTTSALSGSATFTANNAGETITVVAYGPCTSDTVTYTFDVAHISVDEDVLNGSVAIYPNPTRGLFNAEFATQSTETVVLSLVNTLGQELSRETVEINGTLTKQFDLSEQPAGVYLLRITTDRGVMTQRITVE